VLLALVLADTAAFPPVAAAAGPAPVAAPGLLCDAPHDCGGCPAAAAPVLRVGSLPAVLLLVLGTAGAAAAGTGASSSACFFAMWSFKRESCLKVRSQCGHFCSSLRLSKMAGPLLLPPPPELKYKHDRHSQLFVIIGSTCLSPLQQLLGKKVSKPVQKCA
jgi:hypothetical protein